MLRRYFVCSVLLVLSFLLIAIFGCSTTNSIIRTIRPGKADLKWRVMVLPFIDQAGLGQGKVAEITSNFSENLRKSRYLLLYEPPKGVFLSTETKSPDLSIVTPPELAGKLEDLGINALITAIINPVDITTKKAGIWPFRKLCRVCECSVVVNVVDIISRTLLLTRLESEKLSVPLDQAQTQDEKEITNQILRKTLRPILKHQVSNIVRSLVEEPLTGKILAVDNNTIAINLGKDVGLHPGHHFDVFAREGSIPSLSGRSFYLLGKKIGEIKASSIMERYSLAVPLVEGHFLAGHLIRSKP